MSMKRKSCRLIDTLSFDQCWNTKKIKNKSIRIQLSTIQHK